MRTRAAVVTVVRGRADHLARQRRLLAAGPPVTHVVVGMGAPPALDGDGPVTRSLTVPAPGPLPLAHARNAGAAAALDGGATLLVFLDVDCLPGPHLLGRYAGAAARMPDALLAGPVTYLPAGVLPERDLHDHTAPHPARPSPDDDVLLAEPRRELFWSLSFAITARAWTATGGFCEDYTGYGAEDTDFALASGLPLYWVGGAHAYHQHHPQARTDPARIAEIIGNARTFHRRWGWWPMTGWLRELADAGAIEFDPGRELLRLR
ncbi:glycosyltransferase family 2 protein [Pseudonocardia nematodicida]|uniref:Glycosyltransferase family 2 protein n=1 Tax=Pseudonocardia nematodicida TaxID=1206997 RepID=A0ABV1KII4_9PSEU